MRLSLIDVMSRLPRPATSKWPNGVWDTTAFERGTLHLELFMPIGADYQTPHEQDELYIIVRGSGDFVHKGERLSFEPGDVLFVPAGDEHRFERFSGDLVTWVVFWGPKGGEGPT